MDSGFFLHSACANFHDQYSGKMYICLIFHPGISAKNNGFHLHTPTYITINSTPVSYPFSVATLGVIVGGTGKCKVHGYYFKPKVDLKRPRVCQQLILKDQEFRPGRMVWL